VCLGIPARVVEVRGEIAVVDFGEGVLREVYAGSIDGIKPGDTVIVHAGMIIDKVKPEEAESLARDIEEFIEELERKAEEFEKLFS